jgi:hypothetical protein
MSPTSIPTAKLTSTKFGKRPNERERERERERAGTHVSKTYYHRGKTIRPAAQTSQCSDPKPGYREDLEDSRAKAPINLAYILVQSSH